MKQMILEVIDTYDKRIRIVNDIVSGSQNLLDNYRKQRESVSEELRENLAHTESLRKKDYDKMMANIYSHHDEREREVKAMLNGYVHEHQNLALQLRSLLEASNHKDNIKKTERLIDLQHSLEQIKWEQEKHEREVRRTLEKYKYEHDNYFKVINGLLNQGRNIRLPDVKQALIFLFQDSIVKNKDQSININKENNYVS